VHDEALAVATRVAEGQSYVACVGEFKRGKSTLIDALVDDPILPSGIVPITAVPTVVAMGTLAPLACASPALSVRRFQARRVSRSRSNDGPIAGSRFHRPT
jgi:hypothetical protein